MKYYYTPSRMAKIKNTKTTFLGGCVVTEAHTLLVRNAKCYSYFAKMWQFLIKLNLYSTYELVILFQEGK
jgi:hypothetical protein